MGSGVFPLSAWGLCLYFMGLNLSKWFEVQRYRNLR